jgi:hypothetical protein
MNDLEQLKKAQLRKKKNKKYRVIRKDSEFFKR